MPSFRKMPNRCHFNLVLKNAAVVLFFTLPNFVFSQKSNPAPPAKNTPVKTLPPTAPAAKDTAVAKLFEKPADIKWVRNFKGRLDDASVVDLALGFDGKNCRGYFSYAKSRTRFRLEGTLDSSGFNLEERDMARGLTGRLRGTYKNHHLEAEWTNHDNSLGSRLSAEEVPPGQTVTLNCSDNKWSSRYITRYNNARADMVLVRTQNGALNGFLWTEADDKTYRIKGEILPDGNYELEALLPNGKVAALLQGNLKPGQNTDCNWVGSGERRLFKFALKEHLVMGCYDYADYASSYDVLYPRTPCAGCNTWLDQQVNNWVTRCKSTFSEKKIALSPANRHAQRASAWPEIACWTENVFAGYLTFSDTWTEQSQGISFNFDLKTGKAIALEDLFNKGFNAKAWLEDYARKEMPKLGSFATDPKYREWLSSAGFPLFAIRREGLEISTLFNPQYGRQTLLIPYAVLKPNLRKEAAVAVFFK
jgi:hypothetical protein